MAAEADALAAEEVAHGPVVVVVVVGVGGKHQPLNIDQIMTHTLGKKSL